MFIMQHDLLTKIDLLTKEKSRQKRKGVNNLNNSASYFRLISTYLHHHKNDYNQLRKEE